MTVEDAIKKAQEGGYNFRGDRTLVRVSKRTSLLESQYKTRMTMYNSEIFLNPSFWQSLGKAMWWQIENRSHQPYGIGWLYHWHRFIDHLAEGKPAESFFAELT